jgi:hypothetical protein
MSFLGPFRTGTATREEVVLDIRNAHKWLVSIRPGRMAHPMLRNTRVAANACFNTPADLRTHERLAMLGAPAPT